MKRSEADKLLSELAAYARDTYYGGVRCHECCCFIDDDENEKHDESCPWRWVLDYEAKKRKR